MPKWADMTEEQKENHRLTCLQWRKNNPEKARKCRRHWRLLNQEKQRESVRKWQHANKEKYGEYNQKNNQQERLKKALLAAATIQSAFAEMANQTKGETE